MSTYRDLIAGSLRLIGVIGESETPTPYQAETAISALQEMIDAWNADDMMIYTTSFHELPLTLPKQTWTIGPGADIDVPVRPAELSTVFLRMNASTASPVDMPMAILSPIATIYLWPVPNVADTTLNLLFNQTLNSGVGLDDIDNLPPAYRQALRFNLACLLAPEFGREATQTVVATAYKSKNVIGQNNQNIDRLDFDSAIQGSRQGKYLIIDDQSR